MDPEHDARHLLDRIGVLRHPCDLDLVVFFARHPRTMLSGEQLAAFLGYGIKEVASSLDLLLEAGLITRTANLTHTARLYELSVDGPGGGWLPALLKLTSRRDGRLALVWELRRRSSGGTGGPAARIVRDATTAADPRPFLAGSRRKRGGRGRER